MEENDRDGDILTGRAAAGLSVGGALITGAVAVLSGLVTVLNGDGIGGGICLAAAAFAFGLLANAVYRR